MLPSLLQEDPEMPRPKLCAECDTPDTCLSSEPASYPTTEGSSVDMQVCYRSPKSTTRVQQWGRDAEGRSTPFELSRPRILWLAEALNAQSHTIKLPTNDKPLPITLKAAVAMWQGSECLTIQRAFLDMAWGLVDATSDIDDAFFSSRPQRFPRGAIFHRPAGVEGGNDWLTPVLEPDSATSAESSRGGTQLWLTHPIVLLQMTEEQRRQGIPAPLRGYFDGVLVDGQAQIWVADVLDEVVPDRA